MWKQWDKNVEIIILPSFIVSLLGSVPAENDLDGWEHKFLWLGKKNLGNFKLTWLFQDSSVFAPFATVPAENYDLDLEIKIFILGKFN